MSIDELRDQMKYGLKAVIISSSNGIPLVSVKLDPEIDEALIAPFFSALNQFSVENLRAYNETLIKGGELETLVVQKHGIRLIALMDKRMKKVQIGKEAEMTLDLFYEMYEEEIEQFEEGCVDLGVFKKFEILIKRKIKNYYERIDEDEGILSKIVSFFKKKKGELK
ncbi:MAG: hypothetical protein ACOC35_00970 [Promethearchaeia archaeon]